MYYNLVFKPSQKMKVEIYLLVTTLCCVSISKCEVESRSEEKVECKIIMGQKFLSYLLGFEDTVL